MPDEEDLPTIPPRIIEQLKVIVGTITSVTPDRVDIIATVVEIGGKPVLHIAAEVDGRAMTEAEEGVFRELLGEAMAASDKIDKLRAEMRSTPAKTLEDIQ